jgi:hypothetical protein
MAQIYPWDRGINYSIQLGEDAAQAVAADLPIQARDLSGPYAGEAVTL